MTRSINHLFAVSSFLQIQLTGHVENNVLSVLAFNAVRELALENMINAEERYHLEQAIYEDNYYNVAEAINDIIVERERQSQIHNEVRMSALENAFAM